MLAILSTCRPAPSSLEGLFYTRLSLSAHLRGLPEVLLQTLAFSWLTVAWLGGPNRGLRIVVAVVAAVAVIMSLGLVFERPEVFTAR